MKSRKLLVKFISLHPVVKGILLLVLVRLFRSVLHFFMRGTSDADSTYKKDDDNNTATTSYLEKMRRYEEQLTPELKNIRKRLFPSFSSALDSDSNSNSSKPNAPSITIALDKVMNE